ncbi:MAG: hypothetical protein ABR589_06530 [Chthoniobacterales bacterium]
MRIARLLALLVVCASERLVAQEFLDRLGERLTLTAFDDNLRARLSGTLDLEYYLFQQPPPGLIDADGNDLFNPRLTLFADVQLGPNVYFFSQARFDRGFDPSDRGAQVRLDEYALRITPWEDGRVSVQVGKFAAVIGKWIERHLSWDNPFISAPLVYENVTPLEDMSAPSSYYYDGLLHDEKFEYIPEIWGPSYASGASIAGRVGKFQYAAEIKNAALASRPESWDATRIGFSHPTVNARVGFKPNEMWTFGLSASDGAYFRPDAKATLPPAKGLGDYHEMLIAQDITFEWHHLQVWAEFHQARFEIPEIGNGDTFGYFLEAKYKFAPQLFGALRWNQQFFSDVSTFTSGRVPWSQDTSRIEAAIGYRFTPHAQLKLEYYVEHKERASRDLSHLFAAQFTVRF